MYPQALAEYDKIADQDKTVAPENQFVAGTLGWIYAVSGRRADALKIAHEFTDLSSHAYVDFYEVAGICAGLGDKDEAFRWLENGYEERSATMVYLGIDVFWHGMRSDRRYARLNGSQHLGAGGEVLIENWPTLQRILSRSDVNNFGTTDSRVTHAARRRMFSVWIKCCRT
jgi:hypothetical protein